MAVAAALIVILAGCASTKFVQTWKDPTMPPLAKPLGMTIVACVAAEDKYIRHDAEDVLAAELTKRGYKAVPSYTILLPGLSDETLAKAAFEKAGAVGVVMVRPLAVDKEISVTAVRPGYSNAVFWGGYWGHGWGVPYTATTVQSDTILYVETLLYSLEHNKLIWSGRSKTTDPSKVGAFIKDLVVNLAWEINKAHVFKK